MNILATLRPYWRIPVIALVSAVLAFSGSFLFSATYTSTTRLLIHASGSTFLSSTGQDLTTQPGLLDSTLSKTLSETYAGEVTSRSTAIVVVDRLHLDAPDNGHGVIHALEAAVVWTYRCGRAFVTYGFCAPVDQREKAISEVQTGATANQLGVTSGDAAGQPGAFILEVSGSGSSGAQARDVTNALADELVKLSTRNARQAAQTYVDALDAQAVQARQATTDQSAAIAQYESENGISAADARQALQAQSYSALQGSLQTLTADLADSRAQLSTINAQLFSTPRNTTSDQKISTGRSDTSIRSTAANPTYTALLSQQNALTAKIAGLRARRDALSRQVNDGSPVKLNAVQTKLAQLLQDLDLARQYEATLSGQLRQARTKLATSASELTRIDDAAVPAYPTTPKRYLYLALGLLLGGLAGGGLTWLSRRRPDPVRSGPDDPAPPATSEPDASGWDALVGVTAGPTIALPESVDGAHGTNGGPHLVREGAAGDGEPGEGP